ncbi:hypothetical protein B0H66DRAFT_300337 [Apodospora peruviana]|uniref:T6SS Phospholipase effector Tle1-like catalytic domain-containing protein n=1 Tax=Apodospora peruviana TaxID=516989 RepID=A0AAE0I195_9PEZI|nr:hypothetical protein B0H66DRAFT_300337 [Apodospora peruviana]
MAHYFDADIRQGGFVDTSLNPAPKRIIICCDGTWQSSVSNVTNIPSNVTRLARYLTKIGKDDKNQPWQQLVYYDAGIGTGVSDLEAKRQGGTGSGFVGNVIEAYNFIVLNYNLGDQVSCIGFSRGAYTARAVAGLVTDIGIIRPRDMQDFPELYRLYQGHSDSHSFRKTKTWREWVEGKRLFDPKQKNVPEAWKQSPVAWEKRPHGAAPESTRWIEAIGVFDTVGSLGIPEVEGWLTGGLVKLFGKAVPVEKFGFHNVALSPYIKHAYHALALDEHRKPFDATLWHFPGDGVAKTSQPPASSAELREKWNQLRDSSDAKEEELSKAWEDLVTAEMYEELKKHECSKLLQVWFPGVHINIGGGSDDLLKEKKSDLEQIAMITLTWMVEQLKEHLSFEINVTELAAVDRFLLLRPAVDELLTAKKKDHWLVKRINDLMAKDTKPDPWNDGNVTRARVFAAEALHSQWATGPIIDSFEGQMTKAGSKDRTPGEYKEVKLGRTNEQIHPTVQYRKDHLTGSPDGPYNPVPLRSFTRKKTEPASDGTVSYEWVKGGVRIPEYKIGGMNSAERACITGSKAARAWLGSLDKECGVDSWEARALDVDSELTQAPQNHGFQPNNGF